MGEGDLGCGSNERWDPSPLPSSPLGTRKYARDAGRSPGQVIGKGSIRRLQVVCRITSFAEKIFPNFLPSNKTTWFVISSRRVINIVYLACE